MITIIVPCYNQGSFLEEAIKSVIAQTYTDWECIIVNDGSTDNSEEVALQLANTDSRIKVITTLNNGLSGARNHGIKQATGKYILPLDADDRIAPEYLERALKAFEAHPNLKVVYCNASFFGTRNEKWNLPTYEWNELLRRNIIFYASMYKKEDVERIGGYDANAKYSLEDWEFWISLLSDYPNEVLKLEYEGFYYRIKDVSMLTEFQKNESQMNYTSNFIYEKHKDAYTKAFGNYHKLLQSHQWLKGKYHELEKNQLTNENILLYVSRLSLKTLILATFKKFTKLF